MYCQFESTDWSNSYFRNTVMGLEEELRNEYPLHWAVFQNDYGKLIELLKCDQGEDFINKLDVRGRTPLMLAVTLSHNECARVLLEKGADATIQNADMWSPSHEAICAGNGDLLRSIIQHRDYQRALRTSRAIRRLLTLLKETNDFYAEMRWEFSSWLPFVSRMCPSDTYKIYKRHANVRIDTTLVGFDASSKWKRGNQSLIFRFSDNNQAQLVVLDHQSETATVHTLDPNSTTDFNDFMPLEEAIYARMTSPVDTTYVDIEKIGFERSKGGGLLSWLTLSDRTEDVDGYECKVFNASNVEIVTKTRTEHLLEEDKRRYRGEEHENPLHTVLKLVEKREECINEMTQTGSDVYCGLTPQQYLDRNYSMHNRDIGRPKQVTRKSNSFKATLWLCEQYPLDLQDQVLPIIDLMAVNNAHFARLRNFIQLQLPSGFPVKIEIPLFHIVSARITFSAINKPGPHVSYNDAARKVEIDPATFDIPQRYRLLDIDKNGLLMGRFVTKHDMTSDKIVPARRYIPEDELYLQFALEQSMCETTDQSNINAYNVTLPSNFEWDGDPDLAYAIAESMRTLRLEQVMREGGRTVLVDRQSVMDIDLQRAILLSKKEEEERLKACKDQEEELERVIKISLIEK